MQREVAEMLKGRILVGHALHNDLKVPGWDLLGTWGPLCLVCAALNFSRLTLEVSSQDLLLNLTHDPTQGTLRCCLFGSHMS